MVRATNVDMSLDEIISKTRKGKGSIGKKSFRKSGGGGPIHRNRPFGRRSPWKDIDAPSTGGGNKVVRVNISNLAPTVIASDLDELFGNFGLEAAVVNYNEHGESLGTGDITLRKRDAERLIKQYSGVALDGQVMKFALVDTSSISGRVDFGAKRLRDTRPIRNGRKPKGNGAESFLRDGVHEGETKKGGGGFRGRKGREAKPKKTEAELDAELEAYMSKRKN
ncbi:unnamed protein product [Caenorhabditis bovis]|uniref:Chromatin target of PRMT1 protein C-terminal domain-containing protein n=1 Tax=Caenorhabditis bovis TaxID=2654633 RepID=A0A8S1F8F4_9PELO|nr:unnamed protein product [Caenorhabditis bovis]